MKNFFENLSWQKGDSAFVRVLLSWRLWLVGAALGAILGVVLSFVLPRRYETFATVIVDHNREQAWVTAFDKEMFYFYDVENRKLEAVAMGDAVLEAVAEDVPEVSVVALREGMLRIVKQYDGIWELHVVSDDAALSEAVAGAWAMNFSSEVMGSLDFEKELEEARAKFLMIQSATVCEIKENDNAVKPEEWTVLNDAENFFKEIVTNAKGISPYVEISPVSVTNLVVHSTPVNSVILLASVFVGMFVILGLGLIILGKEE